MHALKRFRPRTSVRIIQKFYSQFFETPETGDPNVNISILDNGVRVATACNVNSPLSAVTLYVEAGSRYETSANNGICHFIEHMALKGFHGSDQCCIEASLLIKGAYITSKTTREYQSFTGKCFPQDVLSMTTTLCRIITDLSLDNNAIKQAKYDMCLEMVDADNDPREVTFDYLHQTAFQGTTLANPVIGPTRNVQGFDKCSTLSFLREHYQPYKIVLAAAGFLCHDDIVKCVEAGLGCLPSDPCFESNYGPCRFTGSQIMYRNDSMPHAHVALAVEAPAYMHEDYLALYVASCIVGEWHRSQYGYMNNALPVARAGSHGLSEGFESFYITYRDVGLWGIYYISACMSVEDMLFNIQDEWMRLCCNIQKSDVERGMNVAKYKLAKNVDGVVKTAQDLAHQVLYTCKWTSIHDMYETMDLMRLEHMLSVYDHLLFDRCPAVVALGPVEGLPDYNRIRAGHYWLRL